MSEEERAHHVGIRSERQPTASGLYLSGVVPGFQLRAAERRHEDLLNELVGHPSAATVRQQHVGVVLKRNRAGKGEPGKSCRYTIYFHFMDKVEEPAE